MSGGLEEAESRPSDGLGPREGWIALGYVVLYLAYLFWNQESELEHWITMVLVPVALAYAALRPADRSLTRALAALGLRRSHLRSGLGWALLLGAGITWFQIRFGGQADEIRAMVRSGRALWMFPVSFALMMLLAGFTEEVLFRGFLQTRMEALLRSRWLALMVASIVFGVYHLPYAYLSPHWPSHGDWGAAWAAALGNGVPGGLVLGGLYVVSRGNLLACVLLHSLINATPAMTMIHFGGG